MQMHTSGWGKNTDQPAGSLLQTGVHVFVTSHLQLVLGSSIPSQAKVLQSHREDPFGDKNFFNVFTLREIVIGHKCKQ